MLNQINYLGNSTRIKTDKTDQYGLKMINNVLWYLNPQTDHKVMGVKTSGVERLGGLSVIVRF